LKTLAFTSRKQLRYPVEISSKMNILYKSLKCYVNHHLSAEEKTTPGTSIHCLSDFQSKIRKKLTSGLFTHIISLLKGTEPYPWPEVRVQQLF